jgi:hypothetical protein
MVGIGVGVAGESVEVGLISGVALGAAAVGDGCPLQAADNNMPHRSSDNTIKRVKSDGVDLSSAVR